jgi:hypothetical protein
MKGDPSEQVRKRCLRDLKSDELIIKPVKTTKSLECMERVLIKKEEDLEEEEIEKQIVIVEDDPFQSGIVKNILEHEKFIIHQAFTIEQVKEKKRE